MDAPSAGNLLRYWPFVAHNKAGVAMPGQFAATIRAHTSPLRPTFFVSMRPNSFIQRLTLALGVLLSLAGGMVHAATDELVQQAQALLQQNQGQAAFNLLEPSEVVRAGDPDFDLAMGLAANATAQYMRAIFALERVLSVQPANTRARAELGRALLAVGDTVGARKQLNETKALEADPEMVVAIDRVLFAIDRTEAVHESSVRGYIEAGLGHDTNANSAPADPNVPVPAFGGLVFVLDPSSVKTASGFGSVGAGLMGRYVIDPRWSATGNLNATARRYPAQLDSLGSERVNALTGVTYREERNELTMALNLDVARLNKALSRRQAGLVGEWNHHLNQYQQVSTYFQAFRLTLPDGQSARDAKRYLLGANYAHTLRNDLVAYGGAYAGTERVDRDDLPHLGHRFYGLRMGLQKPVAENLVAFGSASYEHRWYGGVETTFLVSRLDDQFNLNLGLHWVPEPFWRVTPQLSYSRAKSNIIINDFDKRVLSVTARREF
jgi:outer membrane protein